MRLIQQDRLCDSAIYSLARNLDTSNKRRKLLKQIKTTALKPMLIHCNTGFLNELAAECEAALSCLPEKSESLCKNIIPDLMCSFETLVSEPERASRAFPIEILKSPKEAWKLRQQLGNLPGAYGEQLTANLWQLANDPFSIGLKPPRRDDLLFDVAGVKPGENVSAQEVIRGCRQFLVSLADEKILHSLMDHEISRIFRQQFRLSRDEGVETFSELENSAKRKALQHGFDPEDGGFDPEDRLSCVGYEDVDNRQLIGALLVEAEKFPHKQKEAIEVYFQSCIENSTIHEVCQQKNLNYVGVRNNFKVARKKLAEIL